MLIFNINIAQELCYLELKLDFNNQYEKSLRDILSHIVTPSKAP